MYRGFNFSISREDFEDDYFLNYYNAGVKGYDKWNETFVRALESFVGVDGSLSAGEIEKDWFPDDHYDVFISHSHDDKKLAIALSGFLDKTFGLRSFIDSCVWGNSANLLKKIDNRYCKIEGSQIYDYKKRNRSTSSVNMMLAAALSKMIHGCECFILLNTPSSISSGDYIDNYQTKSPWIYLEMFISSIVREREPDRWARLEKRRVTASTTKKAMEEFSVTFSSDASNLIMLNEQDITKWVELFRQEGGHALDVLYEFWKKR